MSNKISQNPWLMDVRVRERNLKSGALTDKDLEKNLAALPDLEGQYDSFGTAQPALEQPRVEKPAPAPVAMSSGADESDSDLDDEDDEDEDEGEGEGEGDAKDESTDDVSAPAGETGGSEGGEPS